ncbi:ParB/RepB/Spo0J family partition protein [Xenorhabdus sp. PR6a]|uniref:ParB/RepB/Spo0J family partition protein n=1 Tax=Xenorhabdus sp. PR6a TaxID=3025877 RepID=UPI00235922AA|nr:ParB/RepB/Spo0J family partition protein [Xenorhabdus sp. PR6a]MDC9582753.1 ParB/RepB/Spo0J family partition protein [Xenorhabdus sp. PR6a]
MESKTKFLEVKTELLVPNGWNTNSVPLMNMDKLKESVTRLGLFKPVIVREVGDKYEILGGEHRWRIAVELKMPTIMIANLGVIDDSTAKQISVIDNERYGEDDAESFARLLEEIQADISYNFADLAPIDDILKDIMPTISTEAAFRELEALSSEMGTGTGMDESGSESLRERAEKSETSAYQTMRFKVATEAAETIEAVIAAVIRDEAIKTGNKMEDAGEALLVIAEKYKEVR